MVKYFEYYNADGDYVRIFIKNTVDTDEGMRFDIDNERTNKNHADDLYSWYEKCCELCDFSNNLIFTEINDNGVIESHTIHDAKIVQQSKDADGENEAYWMKYSLRRVIVDDFDLTDCMS